MLSFNLTPQNSQSINHLSIFNIIFKRFNVFFIVCPQWAQLFTVVAKRIISIRIHSVFTSFIHYNTSQQNILNSNSRIQYIPHLSTNILDLNHISFQTSFTVDDWANLYNIFYGINQTFYRCKYTWWFIDSIFQIIQRPSFH